MPRLLLFILIPALLGAEERWFEVRSGPFYVLSGAGDKAAREQMNQLEQFRFALGSALGKSDLHLIWPLRVVIFKKHAPVAAAGLALVRDGYVTATVDDAGLSPDRLKELARLFISQNTSRLPMGIESGLVDLFTTLEVSGTHVTLGTAVPKAARTRDWARMHLLNVNPDYAGRSRVLINNLEQTSDLEVAYRNAYQKSGTQIEKQLDEYLAAGSFGTTSAASRPINPMRDFHALTASANDIQIAVADLKKSYDDLHGAEAAEGLALQALQANKKDEAKRMFSSAIQSESKSARVYFESALLESDDNAARKLLHKSAELNPLWGEPIYREAMLEKDLDRKAVLLKKAASLDPRNIDYWQTLAKNETDAERFVEAQKAWGGAERAAASPEEREKIRQVRVQLQGERADHEAAERRRKAEEEARDLERVKNESHAAIHEAEAKANKHLNPDGAAAPKAVEWWSGPEAGARVDGTVQRFDCVGRQGKLIMLGADGKTLQLLVRDPSQIVLSGGGELTLACGVQKNPRKALVLYNPKPEKRLGTVGEVVSIEFR